MRFAHSPASGESRAGPGRTCRSASRSPPRGVHHRRVSKISDLGRERTQLRDRHRLRGRGVCPTGQGDPSDVVGSSWGRRRCCAARRRCRRTGPWSMFRSSPATRCGAGSAGPVRICCAASWDTTTSSRWPLHTTRPAGGWSAGEGVRAGIDRPAAGRPSRPHPARRGVRLRRRRRIIDGALQVGKVVPLVRETRASGAGETATALPALGLRHRADRDVRPAGRPGHTHTLTSTADGDKLTADDAGRQMAYGVETFPAGLTFHTWLQLNWVTELELSFFADVHREFTERATSAAGGNGRERRRSGSHDRVFAPHS